MSREGLRTKTAQQAMAVTDIVNRTLAEKVVGAEPPKRLQIRDLDGPSTQGGRRARQSIVLVPIDGSIEGSMMCGWVDTAQKDAEIRTHALVARQFRERYRRELDVTPAEYDEVTHELRGLLAFDSIEARTVDADGEAPPSAAPSRPSLLVVGASAVAVLVLAAIAFAATH